MMNPDFIRALDQKAKSIAKDFLKLESDLIDILQKFDEHKAFIHLGYASLFQYAVTGLKLSESAAYNYITIARKSIEVPALKEEIKQGKLSISKARRIVPVLNKDNAELWINRAKELPKWELEKHLVHALPKAATREIYSFVNEDRLQLQVGVSEELMKKLVQIQELLSSKQKKAASLEDALEVIAKEYLMRHDPIEKTKRRQEREEKKLESPSEVAPPPVKLLVSERVSWQLTPWMRESVIARDQWQCRYVHANGKRCGQKRWLQVHHIVHKSQGGSDDFNNLMTLCVNHHRWMHIHGKHNASRNTPKNLALNFS